MNERQLRGAGLLLLSFLAVAFLVGAVWRSTATVGRYESASVDAAMDGLASTGPIRRVVIPAGWRAEQIADALRRAGISNGQRFLATVRRRSVEGYLAPGIYDIDLDFSEEALADEMVARFKESFTPAMRRRARALGLSFHEVVTLASIVQREMLLPSDAPVISAVFHNRLKVGMPLKANPTLIFAQETGRKMSKYWSSRKDLRLDSPYNTYARKGLPPGPIASPGEDALAAALWPADVDYLFFVARANGATTYARTGRAHVANVERLARGLVEQRPDSELQRFVERLAPTDGHVGFVVKDLRTGETASVNADDFFTSASLYKLAVMLKAFEERARGGLEFDKPLPIPAPAAEGDVAEVRARLGTRPSVGKAIREMIVVSSNAAGVTLLQKLGRANVDRSLRRHGLRDTSLSSMRMVTTPRDVARLLELIATGRAVNRRASAEMERILLRQEIRNRLPRHLPRSVRLAHKTGDLFRLSHDAGVLYLRGGPVVIVAMTEGGNSAEANRAIALLGRFVYDYFESYRRPLGRPPLPYQPVHEHGHSDLVRTVPSGNPGCPGPFRARADGPLSGKTIFLDPGHGGIDRGAQFRFRDGFVLSEAEVNLDVARRLRDLLTSRGATVDLSRCRDVFITLKDRAAHSNSIEPDLAVSLHVNATEDPRKDGTEIYYFHPNGEALASYILGSFQKPALWEKLSAGLALPNYGTFRRPLDVLTFSLAPTVLIEPLFMSNPAEAAALRKTGRDPATRRQQIATGVLRGILNYVSGGTAYEGVQRFGPARRQDPPARGEVRIVAAGDIAIADSRGEAPDGLYARLRQHLDSPPDVSETALSGVARQLAGDVVLGNLEGVLAWGGTSKCGDRKSLSCFAFRARPSFARSLKRAGFTVLNLANNHSADYGATGTAETVAALDGAGLLHAGRPGQIARQRIGPVRVAVIGFGHSPGAQSVLDIGAAKRLVESADTWADVVVVTMHAGGEGREWMHVAPAPEIYLGEQRGDPVAFAHGVVDSGADLVVGHGPHVVRGMEWYRGRLIAYSLGNVAARNSLALGGPLGMGGILQATLGPDGSWRRGRLVSVRIQDSRTHEDSDGAAADMVRRLSREDFGSSGVDVSSGGELLVPKVVTARRPAMPTGVCYRAPALVCRAGARDTHRRIALTFDDGPSVYTERILDVLRRHRVPATFFVTGQEVRGRDHVVRRITADGHEIGNHTYSRPFTPDLSDDQLTTELARTNELIRSIAGVQPQLVRPPYGSDAARVARVGAGLGLGPTVLWSVRADRSAARIVESVVSRADSGAIVRLHDGQHARGTLEALPRILATLKQRGFRFVSVSDVLNDRRAVPPQFAGSEVAQLSPREKAALLVVSGTPVPDGAGGALIRQWSRHARRSGALVFADQEGGRVKSFPKLPPRRPASWYSSAPAAFAAGRASGAALRRVGVHVDLAPVLDSSDGPLGPRHFRNSAFGLAFARGLAAGGAGACAKHFPGLGSTRVSTDEARVRGTVRGHELSGFGAAIRAGVPCVMVGHAVYGDLGRRPASLEPATYRLLRNMGFDGVAITDDLDVLGRSQAGRSARLAMQAGADLVLFTSGRDAGRAIDALVPLARRGLLDDKVERVLRLRRAHGL